MNLPFQLLFIVMKSDEGFFKRIDKIRFIELWYGHVSSINKRIQKRPLFAAFFFIFLEINLSFSFYFY